MVQPCTDTQKSKIELLKSTDLFDTDYYLSRYPNIAAASLDPHAHYIERGAKERRDPHPLFDTTYYFDTNPDLAASGMNPLIHYILEGGLTKRDPHPLFDTSFYLEQTPELDSAELNPLLHYMQNGSTSDRDPHHLFSTGFYREKYPDVFASGLNPLVYYLLHGWQQDHDPHPQFDTSFYLQQYPDVRECRINPLKHYVQHGSREDRLPHNIFLHAAKCSLQQFYSSMREIEPLLPAMEELEHMPVVRSLRDSQAGKAYLHLTSILEKPFAHLVLAGKFADGCQSLLSLVDFLVGEHGADSVLVLSADLAALSFDKRISEALPRNVRFIGAEVFLNDLALHHRMNIVVKLILQATPEAVYNCQSDVGKIILSEYGLQLSHVTRLVDCSSPPKAIISPQTKSTTESTSLETEKVDLPIAVNVNDVAFDVSIVITCHKEGKLLEKTIAAAKTAVAHARQSNLNVEWLFVLDNGDEATRRCLDELLPAGANCLETDYKDPGLARNAGARQARGEFVAFVDGDDIFSPNWLEAAYQFSKTLADKPAVLHPVGNIFFGENQLLMISFDSEDPKYSRNALFEDSAWLTCPFAKRSVILQHPYSVTESEKGFGFEDWLWNCDTIASGVAHKIVPETFLCYRVKPAQASRNARAHSCILGRSKLFELKFQQG